VNTAWRYDAWLQCSDAINFVRFFLDYPVVYYFVCLSRFWTTWFLNATLSYSRRCIETVLAGLLLVSKRFVVVHSRLTFVSTRLRKASLEWQIEQEAQLPQRDRAKRCVSKFWLCFMRYGSQKGFKQQKWPSRSFSGIGNGAIR